MGKLTISRNTNPKSSLSLGGHIPSITKEVQKVVEVVVPQIQERIIQVQIPIEKIVEVLVPQKVEVFVDRIVNKEIEVVREVEKRVEVEKIVHVPVEKLVYIDRIVKQEILKKDNKSIIIAVIISLICGIALGRL